MKLDTMEYENRMKKTIEVYKSDLESIRVGRASPAVLNRIMVPYYGVPTPIPQMAEIKVPDARTIAITPWDATSLKAIDKAIQESDLGIHPTNDGKVIRLAFPQLTEERRNEIKKKVAVMGEESKVAIRNIRRDYNDKCKAMKKNSEMTEDEQKASEKSIQDLTDKYIQNVDTVTAQKEKDIMEF